MDKEKFEQAAQIRRAIWRLSEDRSIVAGLELEEDELEPVGYEDQEGGIEALGLDYLLECGSKD